MAKIGASGPLGPKLLGCDRVVTQMGTRADAADYYARYNNHMGPGKARLGGNCLAGDGHVEWLPPQKFRVHRSDYGAAHPKEFYCLD